MTSQHWETTLYIYHFCCSSFLFPFLCFHFCILLILSFWNAELCWRLSLNFFSGLQCCHANKSSSGVIMNLPESSHLFFVNDFILHNPFHCLLHCIHYFIYWVCIYLLITTYVSGTILSAVGKNNKPKTKMQILTNESVHNIYC